MDRSRLARRRHVGRLLRRPARVGLRGRGRHARADRRLRPVLAASKAVAGIGPLQHPSQPPVWTTYVATDDADATAAAVPEAGGQVALPPMAVVDAGRIAFFLDPAGAMFCVGQGRRHPGCELVSEPGALG